MSMTRELVIQKNLVN